MTKLVKIFVAFLMLTMMSVAMSATRYAYITKEKKQRDGTVIVQKLKLTYINNRLRAKEVLSEVVKGAAAPVVKYRDLAKKKTLADGSVVETVTRLTYTNGKLTAKDVVSTRVVTPPTPVVTYAYTTKTKTLDDGSVVEETWKYTKVDGKLTAKDVESTKVITPAPVVEPVVVAEPAPAPVVEPVVVAEPVIRYAYVTKKKTLADGSVIEESWKMTYVDNKLTAKDLIDTKVISGPALAVAPTAPTTTTTDPVFDPNFNAATYYNNPNMGTPTAVPSFDPKYYLTPEAGKAISAIGANYAYSRGWTGKGSTILVMDTGIDVDGSEFAGKIKYSIDYTNTGIQDTYGHGSQVASIAAGAMDGKGMYGVAFDANLAIAKIGSGKSTSTQSAQNALLWAQQYSDIVVANLSSNTNYSSTYTSTVSKLSDGTYTSSHAVYGGTNYYNLDKPEQWANVLGKEMVLVVSAGNQNLKYTQAPAVFASATDANGKLLLNGQMIIAGGWNTSTNSLQGNGAGHVCKVVVDSVCRDKYRTSDFFLLAPAVAVESVDYNGTARTSTGTSFSAPIISGAVAVVHQLWPYMKGDQLAQLLFKTANKDLPNYDVNVMGQGLLDLNKATQPVGNLGISVTGRTGTAVPLSGSLSVAGGTDTTVSSVLSNVSAVDSFQRDFTVNLSPATGATPQPTQHMKQTAGQSWSGKFAGQSVSTNGLAVSGYGSNMSVSVSNQAFTKEYQPVQYQATITTVDHNPWVNFSGMWGQSTGSTTSEFSVMYSPEPTGSWAQAGFMNTVGKYNYAMVTKVSDIQSMYAVAGWRNDNVNLYAGIKPMVVSGSIDLRVPTSVDVDGNMNYTDVSGRIRNRNLGFLGASYDYVKRNQSVNVSATYGQDGTGQIGVTYKLALQ